MPIPKPKKGEKEQEFMSRCMSNKTMRDEYPDQKQRSAICYKQWRTKEMIQFSYQVPITEAKVKENDGDFIIEGTAINVTTTGNNHKFLEDELEPSAHTLNGVPLLADHRNEIAFIKGRVIKGKYEDKQVKFRAKVIDKDAQEMIRDGRLDSVSVGATLESFEEDEEDGSYVCRGITFRELSLVAVGADEGATFGVALSEAYKLTTGIKNKEEIAITTEKKTGEAPDTVTKEELADTVAKAVEKAVADALAKKETEDKQKADEKVTADEKAAKEKAAKEKEEADSKAAKEKAKAEAEEKAAEAAAEAEEDGAGGAANEKYKMVEGNGSIKGGSLTMERVI